MDISRRKFVGAAAAAAAVAVSGSALSACGGSSGNAGSSESEPAVIGYWGGTCEAPIFVAYANGYFQEEGIEPELILLDAAGGTSSDTMVARGEVDCYELTPDKFMPIQQGLTMRIVDSLHKGCIQGATLDGSGIETVDDLEGKTVAINNQGTIAQIMISGRMAQHGLDPDKVDWVVYQNPLMDDALRSGEIDAFSAFDPFADLSVAKGGAHKFWSWHEDEESKDYLCCFVGVNALAMDRSETLAPKLCRAFKKANEFIAANPEEAAQIIIDGGYVEVGGDNGFTKEIMVDEIKAYEWLSGDKQALDDSFKWIWEQVWYAGALESQDFASVKEFDEWAMGDLYDAMVVYCGEDA